MAAIFNVNGGSEIIIEDSSMMIPIEVTWATKGDPIGDPGIPGELLNWGIVEDSAGLINLDKFEPPFFTGTYEEKYITYCFYGELNFTNNIYTTTNKHVIIQLVFDQNGYSKLYEFSVSLEDLDGGAEPELPEPEQPSVTSNKIASKGRLNQMFKEAINNNSVTIFNSDLTNCPTFEEVDGYTYTQNQFIEGSTMNTYVIRVGDKDTVNNQLFTEDSVSFRTSKRYQILLFPNSSGRTGYISNTIYYDSNNTSLWSYENGKYVHRINMEFQLKNGSTTLQRATSVLCISCTKQTSSNIMTLDQMTWESGTGFNAGYAFFDATATNKVTNISVELTTSPFFTLDSGTTYTVPTAKQMVNHAVYWPLMYLTYTGGKGEKE